MAGVQDRESIPISPARTDENCFHVLLAEHGAVHWQYNKCFEDPDRPFEEFAEELLADLDQPGVQKLILDLRRSRGGSEWVVDPVYGALKSHRLNVRGGLIVLVGVKTFSSAKGLALKMRNNTEAILIGNPWVSAPASADRYSPSGHQTSGWRWARGCPQVCEVWTGAQPAGRKGVDDNFVIEGSAP